MTKVQNVNLSLSPLLAQTVKQKPIEQTKEANVQNPQMEVVGFSPLLVKTILAQNKQILPLTPLKPVETPASIRVAGYHNNLKDMMRNNQANILAVILRTMNAQDEDGNELIQGDEKSGFIALGSWKIIGWRAGWSSGFVKAGLREQ